MSFLRRIFTKKAEDDYETILSNLATDIQKRQQHLSEIRLRERRSTLLVTLYTLAGWVAYVSLWYLNMLPHFQHGVYAAGVSVERAVKGLPVVIGPIIILFVRRIVQIWYMRKGDAEEKSLKELMKKRRNKVEEIKKKTNYYSTRDLIQKYDEGSPSATPLRQPLPQQGAPQPVPQTPLQRRPVPGNGNPRLQTPGPPSATLQSHLSPTTPAQPIPPPRKQWYDKLADALLGDDDPNFASPSSRYALICEKCFSHNGLVKESMWEDAQYLCPKCGHFNESARAKKGRSRQSPTPSPLTKSSPSHPGQPASLASRSRSTSQEQKGATAEGDLPTVDSAETAMEVDSAGPSTP